MTQGKVGGQKKTWAGLDMRQLIKSSCRARSTLFYLIRCERRASQVQLVHLLREVSSLTGASSFVEFTFACTMDNLCHVSSSRETSRRHVRERSCPTSFGATLVRQRCRHGCHNALVSSPAVGGRPSFWPGDSDSSTATLIAVPGKPAP